jgi:2'-5' RNA ligase
MRLFVAALFTPKILSELCEAIDRLRRTAVSGNFTHPGNLHMTLAFIGETMRVEDIARAMREARPQPFEITLSGCGMFRGSGGNIVWAGIADNRPLAEYAVRLADALRQKGFKIESRTFKPHITLGRQVVLPERLNLEIKPLSMRCNKISLMRSDRPGGRLTYTEIRSVSTE